MITKKKPVEKQKQQRQDLDLSVAVASNNQLIAATPISVMTTTSVSSLPPPPPPPSTSSPLDFFHSKNSKILSNALSNLTAAIVPAHVASSSSISSMKLLNNVIESTRRNAGFVDSIKKSFLSSASEKRKGM